MRVLRILAILGCLTGTAAVLRADAAVAPVSLPPTTCAIAADPARPIAASGREVHCAVDIGSRNAKLAVISLEHGKPLTARDERQCRIRLDLGTKSYDAKAPAGQQNKPLAAADIEALAAAIAQFQSICTRDKGTMAGADATEWARHATNIGEVQATVAARTGLGFEVLTPEREAQLGYAAATHAMPGHVVVDPGSNSFQVTWQAVGDSAPRGLSIPLGYEQAANLHFASAESYAAGREAYARDIRERLAAIPGFADAKAAAAKAGTLLVLGQDGAVHLVVRGELRDRAGHWLTDDTLLAKKLADTPRVATPEYGEVTAVLSAGELKRYLDSIDAGQFAQLRTEPVRGIYGTKAMVVPALLELLSRELAVERVVLAPHEMPTGYILAKLAAH
jgi:hypothetical protein